MSLTEERFMKIVDTYGTHKLVEGTFLQKSLQAHDVASHEDAMHKREEVHKIAEERREAIRTAFDDIIDIAVANGG
jgi:predicted neutral ceramidase superfamily lipid hydrolase